MRLVIVVCTCVLLSFMIATEIRHYRTVKEELYLICKSTLDNASTRDSLTILEQEPRCAEVMK